MDTHPIKIQRGMARQLQIWRETVSSRDQRLGWKVGFNRLADQQRLDLPSLMLGYLSHEHCLLTGEHYPASPDASLLIEPEVAILIGHDVPAGSTVAQAQAAIAAYSAALELVDTTRSVDNDIEEILAGNLFHASVVLAESRQAPGTFSREQLDLSLSINNREVRTLEPDRVPDDFSRLIIDVASILAANGEQLKSGDWIITGAAATPAPVQQGDEIKLDMGILGQTRMKIV
ncbi:MAG: fumarylacetoacetate hydrolase family protein [Gammaproteobacteria bacterium]|nr:fumarylacetoacetate hydrolase family protein [Gammaproteobacteria bacterium]